MSDSIRIRPATPADRAVVTQLFRQSYPRLLPDYYAPDTLRAALPHITTAQPALLDCGTYLVAQNDKGDLIGAGGWTDTSPARGVAAAGEGHVRHVATHPSYLRQGVGRQLVEAALSSARAFGVDRMNCMSTLAALRFYRSMGFRDVGEVELTLAPGVHFPAVQMVCEL